MSGQTRLNQLRVQMNFHSSQGFRHRAVLFGVERIFLKRRIVNAGNFSFGFQFDFGDRKTFANFFQLHFRGGVNARGRDAASKKPETSSSMDKGRVWEVPSQKEKRDLIVVIFCRYMALWGPCPPLSFTKVARFERNRAVVLTVHFEPITSGRDICKILKNRASKEALFNG